jgi:hypothetical protein
MKSVVLLVNNYVWRFWIGASLLAALCTPSVAQTARKERVLPTAWVVSLSPAPSGWYESKEAAFAAYTNQWISSTTPQWSIEITSGLYSCPGAKTNNGVAEEWCFNFRRYYGGVLQGEGMAGGISTYPVCPYDAIPAFANEYLNSDGAYGRNLLRIT